VNAYDEILHEAQLMDWEVVTRSQGSFTLRRPANVDPESRLARLAAFQGFQLMEQMRVLFTSNGNIYSATLSTPNDQRAIDGQFNGVSESVTGRNRRAQVIALLAMERNYG